MSLTTFWTMVPGSVTARQKISPPGTSETSTSTRLPRGYVTEGLYCRRS